MATYFDFAQDFVPQHDDMSYKHSFNNPGYKAVAKDYEFPDAELGVGLHVGENMASIPVMYRGTLGIQGKAWTRPINDVTQVTPRYQAPETPATLIGVNGYYMGEGIMQT